MKELLSAKNMYPSQFEANQNVQYVNDQHLHHHRNIYSNNDEMDNQVSLSKQFI